MKFIKIKKLVPLLFLSFSLSSWAGLSELVLQKTENYKIIINYYQTLLNHLESNKEEAFCIFLHEQSPTLNKILEDDFQLVFALRKIPNIDFLDYATHIESNSYSPLISYYSRKGMCENYTPGTLLGLIQSLKYDLINENYLKQSHQFWIEAYGPFSLTNPSDADFQRSHHYSR